MSNRLAAFLAGENDSDFIEEVVDELFQSQTNSPHEEVHHLLNAWETSTYIHASGFEILFEQGRPFQDWLDIFMAINFLEAIPILHKVDRLVPEHIYLPEYNTDTRTHIDGKFDELKACAYAFYDLGDVFTARVGDYIRAHASCMFPND